MQQSEFVRRIQPEGSGVYGAGGWQRLHVDLPLLLLLLIACASGLFVLYSASGHNAGYVERQTIFMGLGFFAMLVAAQFSPRFLRRWAFLPYIAGLALLIAVVLVGTGAKGAQRWLDLGFFRFQPSEILKIASPLMLASFLSTRDIPPKLGDLLIALVIMVLPAPVSYTHLRAHET